MPPSKFVPTPFETTFKSSRQQKQPNEDVSPKPVRRFAPEVVETTKKSNRRTFTPEPVETIRYSSRQSSRQSSQSRDDDSSSSSGKTVRRFVPELIDTTERSKKSSHSQETEKTEHGVIHHDHALQIGNGKSVDTSSRHMPPPEQRRAPSALDGTRPAHLTFAPERQHSFRCPDLDTIESSGSERGSVGPSSRSSSVDQQSPNTASESSFTDLYKRATRIRESVDENFSHYLLQLEAKKAEERLRDQALAAFPNSDFHEPVQHFMTRDSDSDDMEIEDRPVTWDGFDEDELIERITRHRQESVKIPWEQRELQRHAEKAEQERKANGQSTPPTMWWSADTRSDVYRQENEIRSMRDRARPPMLGRDLVFPRCPSPEPARFDITQAPAVVKRMCQQSSCASSGVKSTDGGLWCAAPKVSPPSPPSILSQSSPTKAEGLWGGFCAEAADDPIASAGLFAPTGQTGLMTPRRESLTNPFDQSFASTTTASPSPGTHTLRTPGSPPTPPESVKNLDMTHMSIDAILAPSSTTNLTTTTSHEAAIQTEFPDSFITQVFNYLSLGYPSLARAFDPELSKISRIPISELRSDDARAKADARGYIRLGEELEASGMAGEAEGKEESCVRWRALKLYVHEWARQEKDMVEGVEGVGGVGTGARRGSWAF